MYQLNARRLAYLTVHVAQNVSSTSVEGKDFLDGTFNVVDGSFDGFFFLNYIRFFSYVFLYIFLYVFYFLL